MSASPWSASSGARTLARSSPWSGSPGPRTTSSTTSGAAVQSGPSPSGPSPSAGTPRVGRLIEVVTVVLLGVASIGSAWSAYQVSRWNGVETDEARVSAAFRIEASREYAQATQTVAYDASAVSQFGQAVASGNVELQEFLRQTIIRPAFEPVLQQWRAEIDAGEEPTNLLEKESYLEELFADSSALDASALDTATRSEEAGNNADGYVRITLFFAMALFFAGITASFNSRLARIMLLSAAGITLVVAIALVATYPIA